MQKELSNNFKSLRVRRGLSQDEVANQLGITRQTFNRMEKKPTHIKASVLKKMSTIYKCSLDDFFLE